MDESTNAPPLAATFENRRVTLAVDARGRITSLRSKASNRELLGHPQELVWPSPCTVRKSTWM